MSRFCEVWARRGGDRFGGRRGVFVWMVLLVGAAVSLCVGWFMAAGSVGAASEGSDSVGAAPVWPFRGVVNYGEDVLEYWDAETGAVSEVWLGEPLSCPSPVAGNDEYLMLESFEPGGGASVILRVPWGDEAYPYFAWSEDVPPRYFGQVRDVGVEVSTVAEGFRVSTAEGEAYYRLSGDAGALLVGTGGSLEEHLGAVGVESDEDYEFVSHYRVFLDGIDGFHYGVRLVHPEPNCPWEEGFIVAGDTGEVVACGLGRGGPLLVLPEGAPRAVERFALPRPGGCDPAEDWHSGLGGLSLASDWGG